MATFPHQVRGLTLLLPLIPVSWKVSQHLFNQYGTVRYLRD